jgi:hypothetical protein
VSESTPEATPIQDGDEVFLDMPGDVVYTGTAYATDNPEIFRVVLSDGYEGYWMAERLRRG